MSDRPPCICAALADRQTAGVALHAGNQEGARLAFRRKYRRKKKSPPTASTTGNPVSKATPATVKPKSARSCENLVAQVTPASLTGGHCPLTLMTIRAAPAASTIASAG